MKKLKVIKIGGNIIDNPAELQAFLKDFARIKGLKILVHGGGKLATKLAKKMNIPVKMIDGRRITDQETLDVITMVYAGKISKNIVTKLQSFNCHSVGFSGADGNTIVSEKRPVESVDYGFVGDVVCVDTTTVELLLNGNITPVFCAITHTKKGQLLNTNADTIAAELAIAFVKKYKTELYYCFEKSGVLENINDENSVIDNITKENYKTLVTNGVIADGMLPKLSNCFDAIAKNVSKVCIGKQSMLFDENSKFTTIKA